MTAAGRRRTPIGRSLAISAGTAPGWNDDDEPGHGVFLGLLRANDLPSRMPQHEECDDQDPRGRRQTSR